MLGLCLWHKQPWPYFFVLLIPTLYVLCVAFFDAQLRREGGLTPVFWALYLAFGLALPLSRVPHVLERDNAFQRHEVALAERLLEPGETYLAGLEMIYTRDQAAPELSWLDSTQLQALARSEPADLSALLERLRAAPPKLLVWNYRLAGLPDLLRRTLEQNYTPLHGNLRIYAPRIAAGSEAFDLAYPAVYALVTRNGGPVEIDGETLQTGQVVQLAAGTHRTWTQTDFRLILRPTLDGHALDPAFTHPRPLFEAVYTH